jgi:hypothetical protein
VISNLNQNLPALLESAHISNATLAARISAAVNLILSTVNNFAALMPQKTAATGRRLAIAPPNATQLKRQWNQQICAATGNDAFDSALSGCIIR